MHLRSDGAGPKLVPLLLHQPLRYEVKDLSDGQCEGDRCDPHGSFMTPEALAIEPHQVVSKELEKDITFLRHWAFCPSLART